MIHIEYNEHSNPERYKSFKVLHDLIFNFFKVESLNAVEKDGIQYQPIKLVKYLQDRTRIPLSMIKDSVDVLIDSNCVYSNRYWNLNKVYQLSNFEDYLLIAGKKCTFEQLMVRKKLNLI